MKFNYPTLEAVSFNGMRFYETPELKYYASITTVLGNTMSEEKKQSLKNWQTSLGAAEAQKRSQHAADRGTAVHTLIERYLKKEELIQKNESFTQEQINMFNALKLKLNKIDEIWCQEEALYSDLLEIAGRVDCVGVYKGKECIIDYKTSSRIKSDKQIEDYRLQLCAYSIMHNEMFGTNITDGVILMSSDSGFPQEFRVKLEDYVEPLVSKIEQFYIKISSSI